jgi:putative endonuclease
MTREGMFAKGKKVMYYVYILTNKSNKVMYIGVTNDLQRRLYEHKNSLIDGFTKRYNVHKLVYYENYKNINDAIYREKSLKGLLRIRKNELVETINPEWKDLSCELFPNVFA